MFAGRTGSRGTRKEAEGQMGAFRIRQGSAASDNTQGGKWKSAVTVRGEVLVAGKKSNKPNNGTTVMADIRYQAKSFLGQQICLLCLSLWKLFIE